MDGDLVKFGEQHVGVFFRGSFHCLSVILCKMPQTEKPIKLQMNEEEQKFLAGGNDCSIMILGKTKTLVDFRDGFAYFDHCSISKIPVYLKSAGETPTVGAFGVSEGIPAEKTDPYNSIAKILLKRIVASVCEFRMEYPILPPSKITWFGSNLWIWGFSDGTNTYLDKNYINLRPAANCFRTAPATILGFDQIENFDALFHDHEEVIHFAPANLVFEACRIDFKRRELMLPDMWFQEFDFSEETGELNLFGKKIFIRNFIKANSFWLTDAIKFVEPKRFDPRNFEFAEYPVFRMKSDVVFYRPDSLSTPYIELESASKFWFFRKFYRLNGEVFDSSHASLHVGAQFCSMTREDFLRTLDVSPLIPDINNLIADFLYDGFAEDLTQDGSPDTQKILDRISIEWCKMKFFLLHDHVIPLLR
jgi:hypothetical protein